MWQQYSRSNVILKRTVGFKTLTICLPFSSSRGGWAPVGPGFPGSSVPFSNCAAPVPCARVLQVVASGLLTARNNGVALFGARNMCSTHSARLSIRQFCASRVAPAISRMSGPSYRIESSTVRYIWLSDRCLLKIIRNYNRPRAYIRSTAFKYSSQSPWHECLTWYQKDRKYCYIYIYIFFHCFFINNNWCQY